MSRYLWLRPLMHHWFGRRGRKASSSRPAVAARRRVRPSLEMLEDRTVPAVFNVGAGDVATLIADINTANGNGQSNVINLTQSTYDLTAVDNSWYGPNGLPPISSNLTIHGNGATIQRDTGSTTPAFRLFYVSGGLELAAGSLTMDNLTLQNGFAQGGSSTFGGGGLGAGGAIFNQGTLNLTDVTLTENTATGGFSGGDGFGNGGGGMGQDAPATGAGGGFGGSVGTFGGAGGAGEIGGGGGGGGFITGANGTAGSSVVGSQVAGVGGGEGGFAQGSHDGGAGGIGPGLKGETSGSGGNLGSGGGNGPGLYGGGGGGVGGGGGASASGGGGSGGFGGGGGFGSTGGAGGFGGGGGGSTSTAGTAGAPGFGAAAGTAGGVGGSGAGMGGAIFNMGAATGDRQATLVNCTLAGNTAQPGSVSGNGGVGKGLGGAVFNLDGNVTLNNDTLDSNVATQGGAVYNLAFGNNISTGGTVTAALVLNNSILADSNLVLGPVTDLFSNTVNGKGNNTATVSGSNNLVMSNGVTNGLVIPAGVITVFGSPNLGPLQNNGGLTPTLLPKAGSPALGAGDPSLAPSTDQRGLTRPAGGPIDLGSVQLTDVSTSPPGGGGGGGGGGTTASPPSLIQAILGVFIAEVEKDLDFGNATAEQQTIDFDSQFTVFFGINLAPFIEALADGDVAKARGGGS